MDIAEGMKVGVLAIQGDVGEHVQALESAMSNLDIDGLVVEVRRPAQMEDLRGLLIPGGESSTISKNLRSTGLDKSITELAGKGGAIMGTCAGCIIVASELDEQDERDRVRPLGLMDIAVDRNAFGRQRESFQVRVGIEGLDGDFEAVFIRAPAITRTWGSVEVLADIKGETIMAIQGNILALTFHPELVPDTRVHELFLKMC